MKISEFKKQLAARGVTFKEGTRHTKLYFGGRQSTLPRHGSKDLGEKLRSAIMKQLGLK